MKRDVTLIHRISNWHGILFRQVVGGIPFRSHAGICAISTQLEDPELHIQDIQLSTRFAQPQISFLPCAITKPSVVRSYVPRSGGRFPNTIANSIS